eukprot:365148-Chlamydomonas_euryale.AAC.17
MLNASRLWCRQQSTESDAAFSALIQPLHMVLASPDQHLGLSQPSLLVMPRRGMRCRAMARHRTAWHCMARHGMALHGTACM